MFNGYVFGDRAIVARLVCTDFSIHLAFSSQFGYCHMLLFAFKTDAMLAHCLERQIFICQNVGCNCMFFDPCPLTFYAINAFHHHIGHDQAEIFCSCFYGLYTWLCLFCFEINRNQSFLTFNIGSWFCFIETLGTNRR